MYKAVLAFVSVIALEVIAAILIISPVMIQQSASVEARWVDQAFGAETAK